MFILTVTNCRNQNFLREVSMGMNKLTTLQVFGIWF